MSGAVVLLCNDEPAGRAIAQACRSHGIAPPLWRALRPGWEWRPEPGVVACVNVAEADSADGLARSAELGRSDGLMPVIWVGQPSARGFEPFRHIEATGAWPERVALALIDALGLTEALLPNYENRLRVLGRELDRRGYTSVSISEQGDTLLVEPESEGQSGLPTIIVKPPDFRRWAREALNSRGEQEWERPRGVIAVAGHEALLRSLGQELDRRGARDIRIVSLARSLVLTGVATVSPYDAGEPFQEIYRSADLQHSQRRGSRLRQRQAGWIERIVRALGIR